MECECSRTGVWNVSVQRQENGMLVFKSMVWNVTYKGTGAWNINHSKKRVLMGVFKELEYGM